MKLKPIKGFPGYKISSKGSVFNGDRKLTVQTDDRGYKSITLYKDGESTFKYIHQLVGSAFLGSKDEDWINHLDGDKSNCSVDNLEISDVADNTSHAFGTGLAKKPKGEANGRSKLSAADVKKIKKSDKTNVELGKQYDIDPSQISRIKNGRRWGKHDNRHVSNKYSLDAQEAKPTRKLYRYVVHTKGQ